MIKNDKQMALARECIALLQSSLADLKREVLPKSKAWYEVMAEGPTEHMNRIQTDIDDYLARKNRAQQKPKAKTTPRAKALKTKKKSAAQIHQD